MCDQVRWVLLATLLCLQLLITPVLALDGWSVRVGDPPVIQEPLDLQLLPGSGEQPARVALLDPASNSYKIWIVDLDGRVLEARGPSNGPDPWDSGLRPFGTFAGPQLPLGAWSSGTWEAVQDAEGLLNLLEVSATDGRLKPLHGALPDARHPGDLPLLPFEAHLWAGDPVDGTIFAAGESGVYRFVQGKGSRLPIQPREDWLQLEPGPDGTFVLLEGPQRASLQLTARLYDRDGTLRSTSQVSDDLTGALTLLDVAQAGAVGGWLALAIIPAPYPVSLTQHLNDGTRRLLRERSSMPFLFRFSWDGGRLAALTPLPDLPQDLELARISADLQSVVMLVRGGGETFLRILTLGNLSSIGDVPLLTGRPTLQQPLSLAVTAAGEPLVLDQQLLPTSSIPVVALYSEREEEATAPLLPLPGGARLDVGGCHIDGAGTLWWGGQVVDPEGVRGSVWQQCTLDGTVLEPHLFSLIPGDLFSLDLRGGSQQMPYLLAQSTTPQGAILAIAGTFDPPQQWLLEVQGPRDPTPVLHTLPPAIDWLSYGQVQLHVRPDGTRLLSLRQGPLGEARLLELRKGTGSWDERRLLPSLGGWLLGTRSDDVEVWVMPGLGLATATPEGRLLELAVNPSPWLESVSVGVSTTERDFLLLRQLGQVWEVEPRAYRRLPEQQGSAVNDALLELDQLMRKYYAREGQFPLAINRGYLGGDLRDYTWERLWEHFIGGRPLQYRRTESAFDLVVWGLDPYQTLYHISERGIVPITPEEGFIPAEKRQSLFNFN